MLPLPVLAEVCINNALICLLWAMGDIIPTRIVRYILLAVAGIWIGLAVSYLV